METTVQLIEQAAAQGGYGVHPMMSLEEEGGVGTWSEHHVFVQLYSILCSQGCPQSGQIGKNDFELLIPLPPKC